VKLAPSFFRFQSLAPAAAMRGLDALSDLTKGQLERILRQVQPGLQAAIRNELLISYGRSGLGNRPRRSREAPGKLRAAMMKVEVSFNNYRWVIRMAGGDSERVYARAGAHRFGAVRQPLTKKKGSLYHEFGSSRGRLLRRKSAAGEFGAAAKRTLKKAVLAGHQGPQYGRSKAYSLGQGGVIVVPPKPPFFYLQADQIARLAEVQARLVAAALRTRHLGVA
jgi:hypothetical protein